MSLFELAGDDPDDDTCKTFIFEGEGHSLGNALRSIISRYSETTFCGYSVPHPSENKILFRIQTNGIKSLDILERGLTDLKLLCNHIVHTFENAVEDFKRKEIDDLNDNCLQHIFSFLPIQDLIRVERVNKRWQLISRKAWKIITIDLKKLKSDNAKQIVRKCGCECTDLHILGITFQSSIFDDISKYCKSLTRLKVSGPSVPNCCFSFTSYPFLLKLQHYDVHQHRCQQLLPTGNNFIMDFLKNSQKLQTFRYRRGTEEIRIENSGQLIELKKIEINLNALFEIYEVRELTLRNLPSKTKSGVVLFSLGLLPSSITSLTITHMSQFEKGFENFKCHALHTLCFFSCKDIQDNVLKGISQKCSVLKRLRVEDCPKISLRCVNEIKARSNHMIVSFENAADVLKKKTIDDLPWDCLGYIFSFLPIQDLIRIERVNKKWQRMCRTAWRTVTIDLSHLKRDYTENIVKKCGLECTDLTISGLDLDSRASYAINEYCKVLTRLKVWGSILPDTWLKFSTYQFMLNLTHYDVHHGFFLPKTSSLIINFLKNATKLQSFRYRGAEDEIRVEYSGRFIELKNIEIDLNALFEVFEVKELILRDMPVRPKSDVDPFSLGLLPSSITLLTIMNMSQFARGCKSLKCRGLQDVSFVSCNMEDYIIEAFLQQCLALKSVRVEDCPKISSRCLREVKARFTTTS